MTKRRPWEDWLEGDVPEEELAAGAAAIEAAAERARQAAQKAARAQTLPPDAPEAGDDVQKAPEPPDAPSAEEPPKVKRSPRQDPILPVVRVKRAAGASAHLLGFVPPTQEQLPIFEGGDGPEASILDIVDRTGLPVMAKGRGAPLELRLAVQILVAVPVERRKGRSVLELKVRELRDLLFPKTWKRRRDWPRVITALSDLNSYRLPVGEYWCWPFHSGYAPQLVAADLDSPVVIGIQLPPGCGDGPPVDSQTLATLGVESAPRFRAYIAGHSIAWVPGRTRIPLGGNPRSRAWLPVRDPHAYRVLTVEDRRRLAFGGADTKHRTRAQIDAPWENLPGIEIVSREFMEPSTGRCGWLILPTDAAAAVRGHANLGAKGLTGELEGANRGAGRG